MYFTITYSTGDHIGPGPVDAFLDTTVDGEKHILVNNIQGASEKSCDRFLLIPKLLKPPQI